MHQRLDGKIVWTRKTNGLLASISTNFSWISRQTVGATCARMRVIERVRWGWGRWISGTVYRWRGTRTIGRRWQHPEGYDLVIRKRTNTSAQMGRKHRICSADVSVRPLLVFKRFYGLRRVPAPTRTGAALCVQTDAQHYNEHYGAQNRPSHCGKQGRFFDFVFFWRRFSCCR